MEDVRLLLPLEKYLFRFNLENMMSDYISEMDCLGKISAHVN